MGFRVQGTIISDSSGRPAAPHKHIFQGVTGRPTNTPPPSLQVGGSNDGLPRPPPHLCRIVRLRLVRAVHNDTGALPELPIPQQLHQGPHRLAGAAGAIIVQHLQGGEGGGGEGAGGGKGGLMGHTGAVLQFCPALPCPALPCSALPAPPPRPPRRPLPTLRRRFSLSGASLTTVSSGRPSTWGRGGGREFEFKVKAGRAQHLQHRAPCTVQAPTAWGRPSLPPKPPLPGAGPRSRLSPHCLGQALAPA